MSSTDLSTNSSTDGVPTYMGGGDPAGQLRLDKVPHAYAGMLPMFDVAQSGIARATVGDKVRCY